MTADRRTVRRERLTDLALIALGSLLFALSVVIFSAPNDIAPGGVTGLATMLNYLFRLPIGVMSVAINIPLLLVGWKRLGHRFLLRTLLGLLLSYYNGVSTGPLIILVQAAIYFSTFLCRSRAT